MSLIALALVATASAPSVKLDCSIWYDPDGAINESAIEPERISKVNVSFREGPNRQLRDIFVVPVVADNLGLTAQRKLRWSGVGSSEGAFLQSTAKVLEVNRRPDGNYSLRWSASDRMPGGQKLTTEGTGICSPYSSNGAAA